MSASGKDKPQSQKIMLEYLNDLLRRDGDSLAVDTRAVDEPQTSDVKAVGALDVNVLQPVMLNPELLEDISSVQPESDTVKTASEPIGGDGVVGDAVVDDGEVGDADVANDVVTDEIVDNEIAADAESGQVDTYKASEWLENGRPEWAQEAFDILLFKVNGMSLAVPLIALGQIYEITDALHPLIGQAPWFVGMQQTSVGQIKVVNTARYVMPERFDESSAQKPNYIMTIDRLLWGLTVNSVDQPIRIQVDDVKWRRERSQQPWLAGIVKDHMCVLVDIPTLGRALLDSDS